MPTKSHPDHRPRRPAWTAVALACAAGLPACTDGSTTINIFLGPGQPDAAVFAPVGVTPGGGGAGGGAGGGTGSILIVAMTEGGSGGGSLADGGRPPTSGGDAGAARDGGSMAADAAPPDARPKGECPDLDGNGQLDCKETRLTNADFRTDVAAWTAETNATAAFSPQDGDGVAGSGAIAVTSGYQSDMAGSVMAGVRQCLPASAGAHALFAQVSLQTPSDATGVSAGVSLQYFAAAGCTGDVDDVYLAPLVTPGEGWRTVQGTPTFPPRTKSVAVRLVILKPFKQAPVKALFDNVLLKAR